MKHPPRRGRIVQGMKKPEDLASENPTPSAGRHAVWDAAKYEALHTYVPRAGESLIDVLAPQAGETILDLGCGTGQLASQIAARGARVIGIDVSPTMIKRAREKYPGLDFRVADGTDLHLSERFDAVFSNAALHWMPSSRQPAVLAGIREALKPGGRFVAELGARGNIEQIVAALREALAGLGYPHAQTTNPWYFPASDEYVQLLEQAGFRVASIEVFERPTQFDGGETGMRHWLEMFAIDFLLPLSPRHREVVVRGVERRLRPKLYRDGAWWGDYRRIRLVAIKDRR